ncbi:hypothetical protein HD554DRAFT_18119 [Boletus coccyginus]|nr:hypothetical protein HD554DRAFT_18119 [Boletus coccyginus]
MTSRKPSRSQTHQAVPDPVLRRSTPSCTTTDCPSCLSESFRGMPTCTFTPARFKLRVDNVLFRIHDTRVFHSFMPVSSPPTVVRQLSGWEAPHDRAKHQLPRCNDSTPHRRQFHRKAPYGLNAASEASRRQHAMEGAEDKSTSARQSPEVDPQRACQGESQSACSKRVS